MSEGAVCVVWGAGWRFFGFGGMGIAFWVVMSGGCFAIWELQLASKLHVSVVCLPLTDSERKVAVNTGTKEIQSNKRGGLHTGLRALHRDERGATSTEYAVILVLIAASLIYGISVYGESLHRLWDMAVDTIYRDVRR
jgi:Flp pilus assembly pilin Flp